MLMKDDVKERLYQHGPEVLTNAELIAANTVAAEPPVRNSESHQSGQTGATYF